MKKLFVLLVLLVFLSGCVGDSSDSYIDDKNTPPPLPDSEETPTTADGGILLPNSKAIDSEDNPPPVPALLGLRNK